GARLACVRRAASVRSEPGSNSQVQDPVTLTSILPESATTTRTAPQPAQNTTQPATGRSPKPPPALPFPSLTCQRAPRSTDDRTRERAYRRHRTACQSFYTALAAPQA